MKTEFITAKRALILLVAVLLSGALMLWLPYEAKTNKGLALLVLVAILWLTEVIPITITALAVPILSIFLGLVETKPALQHFANPTIFLFFGGFALAASGGLLVSWLPPIRLVAWSNRLGLVAGTHGGRTWRRGRFPRRRTPRHQTGCFGAGRWWRRA